AGKLLRHPTQGKAAPVGGARGAGAQGRRAARNDTSGRSCSAPRARRSPPPGPRPAHGGLRSGIGQRECSPMDARFSLTGLLVGFLIGLTGMGGGSLMTPLLILVIGVRPTVAVGSDLAYSAVTKIAGAFQHHRQGTVNHRLAWRMSMGSVPGALLGVW